MNLMDGHADKQFMCSNDKKNVFLIGDSIRLGYCNYVREALSDVAEVFYVVDNCRNTQFVITNLCHWYFMFSDPNKIDVVQFNCGHWDTARWCGSEIPLTSCEEFARNIQMIIDIISRFFPNAKIVFATTTPMNPNNVECSTPRTTDEIKHYNDIAVEVANKNNLIINDLFEVTKNWDASYYNDYCHFSEEGNKILGKTVAERLEKLLK